MTTEMIPVVLIIVANFLLSWKGFREPHFLDKYKFEVDPILVRKEYVRLVSSGFLHVDWLHLIFNMITLYSFAEGLSAEVGVLPFLLIYAGSLIGGDLLALFIHRSHGDYSAVGASGAVCGVIFASIVLSPGMDVSLFILPIFVPSWVFALIFIGVSLYGIRTSRGNIGHDAHLGGALIGALIAIAYNPQMLVENYLPILVITVPTIIFIAVIVSTPHILMLDKPLFVRSGNSSNDTIDNKYNAMRTNRQKEIDAILDKISKKGINSLSKKEKEALDQYSRK